MAMHLAILLHIPVASAIIAPLAALVLWLMKRDESHFLDDHGKEALNFQISILIYTLALGGIGFITCGLGWFAIPLIYVLAIVGLVRAINATKDAQYFRYPMCLRLIP